MIRYVPADALSCRPKLSDSMFRDRAKQFHERLGWDVSVDGRGHERDSYDDARPLYVIWENPNGTHGGSMRFLPTTGRTMAREHFSHLQGDADICNPQIWECTRFCLAPDAKSRVAAALMLAGGELMRAFNLTHLLGVFDARMVRIYRMIGSAPEILGSAGEGAQKISLGLWAFDHGDRDRVLWRSGLSSALSEHWFARSFGHRLNQIPSCA